MELSDLKGSLVNPKPALFIFKPIDVECILNNGYAATCAHNNGAINIWEDEEDGGYRGEVLKHYATLHEFHVDELKEIQPFVKEWMKLIK